MTDEEAYNYLKQHLPALLELVAARLRQGQAPLDIADGARRQGTSAELADKVLGAALWLEAHPDARGE